MPIHQVVLASRQQRDLLSQAAVCSPVYRRRCWRLDIVPLLAERQAGKLWIPTFIVCGLTHVFCFSRRRSIYSTTDRRNVACGYTKLFPWSNDQYERFNRLEYRAKLKYWAFKFFSKKKISIFSLKDPNFAERVSLNRSRYLHLQPMVRR